MNESQVIIFLVSSNTFSDEFLKQSDYQWTEKKLKEKNICFLPVLVGYYYWKNEPLLNGLQLLPFHEEKGKELPVVDNSWQNKDYVWADVIVHKIKNRLEEWKKETFINNPINNPSPLIAHIPAPISVTSSITPKKIDIPMIKVEGGIFKMGGTRYEDEKPVHTVYLEDFYIGIHLVTQHLWMEIMNGVNPSHFKNGRQLPVESISWEEAQTFIKLLNAMTNKKYRLPTEAEWEYVAKGGSKGKDKNYIFSGSNMLSQVGWHRLNSNNRTQLVGYLNPNDLGIYDLSGNVCEWIEDNWHENYRGAPIHGEAWLSFPSKIRVIRGGSWAHSDDTCRASHRESHPQYEKSPYIGFRLAMS